MNENCLLCGRAKPTSHVSVVDAKGNYTGQRICASHSLHQVIFNEKHQLHVKIEIDGDFTKNGLPDDTDKAK